MSLDQRAQTEALVQLARQQQPGVRGHRRAPELDAKLRVEGEANRAGFGVTHSMMPSAPARHPRHPHFLRMLSDYGLADSPLKTKMRAQCTFSSVSSDRPPSPAISKPRNRSPSRVSEWRSGWSTTPRLLESYFPLSSTREPEILVIVPEAA